MFSVNESKDFYAIMALHKYLTDARGKFFVYNKIKKLIFRIIYYRTRYNN